MLVTTHEWRQTLNIVQWLHEQEVDYYLNEGFFDLYEAFSEAAEYFTKETFTRNLGKTNDLFAKIGRFIPLVDSSFLYEEVTELYIALDDHLREMATSIYRQEGLFEFNAEGEITEESWDDFVDAYQHDYGYYSELLLDDLRTVYKYREFHYVELDYDHQTQTFSYVRHHCPIKKVW